METSMQRDRIAIKPLREPLRGLSVGSSLSSGNHLKKRGIMAVTPLQQLHPFKEVPTRKEKGAKTPLKTQWVDSTIPVIWFGGSPEKVLKDTYFYETLGTIL